MMAHFGKDLDDFKGSRCIRINSAEQTEQFTVYVITVNVGSYTWTVKHRYSEFHDLHEKLTASYKLDKSLLPPKKLFGNQTESFIKKRQRELEIYLQTITLYLAQHIPTCLAYFLDFDKYEIHGITQSMAEDLYSRGEVLLYSKEPYEVTTLQLYSLTERLKLPEPTCESGDVKKDLGHILDFITRCKYLTVKCEKEPVGTSNILMNKVPFDLTLFKSLQTLNVQGCNMRLISGLETVKQTLTKLEVHESTSSMKEVLLQDAHHWRAEDGGIIVGYWDLVTEVDFSKNSFSQIHESVQLLPNLERLNLSHNVLESIQNLQWLSQLTYLNLSNNNIRHLDSLHTKLGNLKCLLIAHNRLENLHGFAKLFSLQTLDISHNSISKIEELWYVSQLPCIEDLVVTGNAVTNSLDYRTKTLEMFGDRVREIVLDKQRSDQKELDTVAVLQALRKAKTVKIVKKPLQQKNSSVLSLSDMCGDSSDNPDGRSNQGTSPLPGNMSRSVPLNGTEWLRRDHNSGQRSASPLSQVSIKSFNSVQDETQGLALPIAGATAGASPPFSSQVDRLAASPNSLALSDTDLEINPQDFEQVPEAHPFDLNFESVTGAATAAPLSGSRARSNEEVKKGKFLSSSPSLLNKLRKPGSNSSLASPPGSSMAQPDPLQGGETPSQMRNLTTVNNVADLPGMSDQEFLSWLEGQLLGERGSLPRQAAEASGPDQDSIVDIFWCYCEQLSKPGYLFPCCAILTRDKVVIERLASSAEILTDQSTSGLKPCTIVPICNIQQIVLGPCHAFLRLEEAFVGKPGTYTLFGLEPQGLKKFVIKLHKVCEILDVSNVPDFVDMSVQSDLLKEIITWEEQNLSLASDRLALVILVKELGAQEFSFLVLSENQVYCLGTSFVHWPPASFETSPDRSLAFNILHNFSITNKISNIKTHPLPSSDAATQSVPQPEVSGAVQFFMYRLDIGVSPSSDLSSVADKNVSLPQVGQLCGFAKSDPNQQLKESSNISYLFFSAAHRDLFLDRLSNLRAEQAHRLVSNVREEPEGGNELLPQTCRTGNQPACSTDLSQNLNTVQDQKNLFEEDEASTGSSQSGASEDNTIYYSASPSENLSVSPMSNFSRASISPPSAANQQVSGKQNVTSHLVRVEPTPGTGQPQEVHFPYNKLDQVISQKSSIVLKSYDADPEVNIRLKRANANSNSIPANLSGHAQQDFNIAFEHLKRPVGESTNVREESELDQHLRRCIRSYNLPIPLPVKLKPLYLMGGKELREFFKIIVSEIPETSVDARGDVRAYYKGGENQGAVEKKIEELRHVLWTSVVPYTNPKQEIVSLVMISTGGIYLVSDTSPSPSHKSRPSWMMHTRNQSDSVFAWKSSSKASVPANITQMFSPPRMSTEFTSNMGDSGAAAAVPSINKKSVKSFFRFRYEDLHQIDVGVFDQCVRLTGSCADSVFTLAVRDSAATEQLVQYLKDMLTLFYCSASSPAGDIDDDYLLSSWEADDFYRDDSHRTKSTLEGIVYTHPSQVKFVYPGEDAIKDILYLVDQSSKRPGKPQRKPSSAGVTAPSSAHTKSDSSLWLFILCHQLLGQPQEDQMPASQARSVIITPSHFSLSQQDIVTYPLPDFVRGLPEHPCHQIAECRPIEALKRIRMYRCNPHWLALTFVDEAEDFVVDTSIEHFSPAVSNKERQGLSPEVTFYLFIESPQEKDKLVKLLGKIWKQLVTQVGRILDVAHI